MAITHARTRPRCREDRAGGPFVGRLPLLALVSTVGLLLAPATAIAVPDVPATGEDAASLAAERGHELEALTEEYNEAREELFVQESAATAAAAQVAEAEAQLVALKEQLAVVAQIAYTGESFGPLGAFMTSSSPEEFLERISTLDSIAGHHTEVLARVDAARVAAEQAAAAAAAATGVAQEQMGTVQGRQQELQTEIAAYQAQYASLTSEQQERADVAHGGRSLEAPVESVVADTVAAQRAVDTALAQVGDPYVWAAGGPDAFDCSGLTQYAFAAAGIALPHSSKMQSSMGQAVSRADLQPGDLVYFYSPVSHIGIYIGSGRMVHASTFGEPVRVGSVDMAGYVGARRVVS